jgi:small subunit ribosomal protein S16
MLKIRLQRVGRKHEPVFRLVLTDSKNSPKSGKFLEVLGSYDSRRGERAEFKNDRVKYWLSMGAKTSDTVHNILVDKKVVSAKKINVLPLKRPILKPESDKPESPRVEETKSQEATAEEAKAEKETKEEPEIEKVESSE